MNDNKDMSVKKEHHEQSSLKGTLFSVMMVGAFIGLMWAGVFWLYMARV